MIELGLLLVTEKITHLSEKMFPLWLRGKDLLNIELIEGRIVISSMDMTCPFCNRVGLVEYNGYYVCNLCIDSLKKLKKKRRRTNKWKKTP